MAKRILQMSLRILSRRDYLGSPQGTQHNYWILKKRIGQSDNWILKKRIGQSDNKMSVWMGTEVGVMQCLQPRDAGNARNEPPEETKWYQLLGFSLVRPFLTSVSGICQFVLFKPISLY
jgi:hypothetical protein